MKKIILSVVLLLAGVLSQAQSTSLLIDNQTNHTIYFKLHGDGGVCDASSSSGVLDIPPNSSRSFSSVVPWIGGLNFGDPFTMVTIYSGNPNPPGGSSCSAGGPTAYVTGCGALGHNQGPVTNFTTMTEDPPLCQLNVDNVKWDLNFPTAGTSLITIY